MTEEVESLEVETGNVDEGGEGESIDDEGGDGECIGDEGGESGDEEGEETIGEDGVGSAIEGRGVGILGIEGGLSGNVRKEMSSVEKVEEDGRG